MRKCLLKVLHNFKVATSTTRGQVSSWLSTCHSNNDTWKSSFKTAPKTKAQRRGLSGHSRSLPGWHANTTKFGHSWARGFKCQWEDSSELVFVVFCESGELFEQSNLLSMLLAFRASWSSGSSMSWLVDSEKWCYWGKDWIHANAATKRTLVFTTGEKTLCNNRFFSL